MSEANGRKDACRTYVEQTKLLVALASAFVVAPAAMVPLFRGEDAIVATRSLVSAFFWGEIHFVASVLAGYIVLATIAGFQHKGKYDIHRRATRIASLAQIALYVIGLWQFIQFVQAIMRQGGG